MHCALLTRRSMVLADDYRMRKLCSLFGDDFNLEVREDFVGLPNLNNAIIVS